METGFSRLKVQSCKLYNNKYMIVSTQITNTEIFAFIAVLVFKLFSRKILFINRKHNRNCQKVDYFLRKQQISRVNYCKTINSVSHQFFVLLMFCKSLHIKTSYTNIYPSTLIFFFFPITLTDC